VGAAHQALAHELGIRPRQLAALTSISAEVALARVRSGREEAMLDDLTGVLRRGTGMAALEREIARAQRSLLGRLVIAFIDVDGLKEVNDTLGHAAGDQLLRAVAAAVSSRLRGQDIVLRYGGDEFIAVMPETDVAGARQTLVEIRARLGDRLGRKPFSIGLAALHQGDSAQSLVARADAALYESRRLGLD
jgi:diguanylate cyclase